MKVITLDKIIFEKAFSLCNEELSAQHIYKILSVGTDVEKQIALLQLENVSTKEDANLLVSHLTGQDGPIREACALKIKELLLEKNNEFLDDENFYIKYCDAVCDVNPNICRCVIDFLPKLKTQELLKKELIKKLEDVFSRIDNPDVEQKNYLTVRLFNVYWCLEALGCVLSEYEDTELCKKLVLLLQRAISYDDYTINEKIAKIVTKLNCDFLEWRNVYNKLKESNNFYVKRYFVTGEDVFV